MAIGLWMRSAAACLIVMVVVTLVSISQSSASAAEEIVFTGWAPEGDDDVAERKEVEQPLPLVITTWGFVEAARAAWTVVERGGSSVDAVTEGCSACETLRCDLSVGYGGSPDETGETTLDAMIMDGTTMNVGAVGALRSVKDAIRAARLVLEHSEHSLLVGDQASAFALSLGIPGPTNLSTTDSMQVWSSWRDLNCQPNFRTNVVPDPRASCGPYKVSAGKQCHGNAPHLRCRSANMAEVGQEDFFPVKGVGFFNHDTISLAVIDREKKIAVGTSTNGASHKIPGRVGDGPIAGASAYADDDVGACGATGDGDVMMRFLPCYQVVESMRLGRSPKHAARDAIRRIKRKFPSFIGAVFAVNRHGKHAGACHGWTFQYAVRGSDMDDVEIHTVKPITSSISSD